MISLFEYSRSKNFVIHKKCVSKKDKIWINLDKVEKTLYQNLILILYRHFWKNEDKIWIKFGENIDKIWIILGKNLHERTWTALCCYNFSRFAVQKFLRFTLFFNFIVSTDLGWLWLRLFYSQALTGWIPKLVPRIGVN